MSPTKNPGAPLAGNIGAITKPGFRPVPSTNWIVARAAKESDSAMMIACAHATVKRNGKNEHGQQRYKCCLCGKRWTEERPRPLGKMSVPVDKAKLALRLLVEGSSIRAAERVADVNRNTILKLLVHFGEACARFLDERMRGLTLTHLQFDEQWTYVARKQSRLTLDEKAERHDVGDVYLWTCIDQKTKLMPSFRIGKRSADNARRFMMDVAGRLVFPNATASDARNFLAGGYEPIVQISTDGFAAYPEAVDLAFGPYAKYGVIIKEYRNATMIYTPSEMVGTKRTGTLCAKMSETPASPFITVEGEEEKRHGEDDEHGPFVPAGGRP